MCFILKQHSAHKKTTLDNKRVNTLKKGEWYDRICLQDFFNQSCS